jgi:hypothetical protein
VLIHCTILNADGTIGHLLVFIVLEPAHRGEGAIILKKVKKEKRKCFFYGRLKKEEGVKPVRSRLGALNQHKPGQNALKMIPGGRIAAACRESLVPLVTRDAGFRCEQTAPTAFESDVRGCQKNGGPARSGREEGGRRRKKNSKMVRATQLSDNKLFSRIFSRIRV